MSAPSELTQSNARSVTGDLIYLGHTTVDNMCIHPIVDHLLAADHGLFMEHPEKIDPRFTPDDYRTYGMTIPRNVSSVSDRSRSLEERVEACAGIVGIESEASLLDEAGGAERSVSPGSGSSVEISRTNARNSRVLARSGLLDRNALPAPQHAIEIIDPSPDPKQAMLRRTSGASERRRSRSSSQRTALQAETMTSR